MSIDFTKPVTTDNFQTAVLPAIVNAHTALAQWLDPAVAGTLTGTPTGAYRLNGGEVERYNGAAWVAQPMNGINFSAGNVGVGRAPVAIGSYTTLDLYKAAGAAAAVSSTSLTAELAVDESAAKAYIGTRTNHQLVLRTNVTERLAIAAAGNVTISAPVSGATVSASGLAAGVAVEGVGTNVFVQSRDSNAAGAVARLRASNTVNVLDFTWGVSAVPASIRFGDVEVIGINTSRNVEFAVPSAGTTVKINALSEYLRLTNSGSSGFIRFQDGSTDRGYVGNGTNLVAGLAASDFGILAASGGALILGSNNVARLVVQTGGNVSIAAPSAGVALTVAGVANVAAVSATTGVKVGNAANSDTAVLDWYQEGVFTPVVSGTTTAGAGTYTTQVGRYLRLGRMVYVHISLAWDSHTGTGVMQVGGLPFTPLGSGEAMAVWSSGLTFAGQLTARAFSTGLILAGIANGGADALVAMDAAVVGLTISGWYEVA